MTLRLTSKEGRLNASFTERDKPNMFNFKVYDDFRQYELQFEYSFHPIQLSDEAREYLMAIYTSSFGFEAALLYDELSGKSTECFEVKQIPMESNAGLGGYILHLKEYVTPESEILKSLEGVRVDKLENVFTPQPTDDELKKLGKELLKKQEEIKTELRTIAALETPLKTGNDLLAENYQKK